MAIIAESDVTFKVGQTLRIPLFYEGVTGLSDASFTKQLSKDGTGNQSTTGITISQVDASNNPGDYVVTISVSGFVNSVGNYRLVIIAAADTTKKWVYTIRISDNGLNSGTWGQASFIAATNNGKVTDGTNAIAGSTIRILDASKRIVYQTTTDAGGLWGPVYLDNATYSVQASKAGYAIGVGTLTVTAGVATGPGANLVCLAASTASTLTAGELFSYARRSFRDKTGAKADVEIKQAVNEAIAMVARAPNDWQRLNTVGRINLVPQYTTGTVTVADGDATVTIAGGTWPSWAADGDILIDNQWHSISSRTSDTEIELDAAIHGLSSSGLAFTLVQYKYELPADCLRIEEIYLGTTWPWGTEPVSSITLESNRHTWLNITTSSGIWQWSCTNDSFAVWPVETQNRMVNFRYRRLPAELVNDNDSVDWDKNQKDLLFRAIDYCLSLRGEVVSGSSDQCYSNYQKALTDAAVNEKSPENNPIWRRGNPMMLPIGFQGNVT